MTDKEQRVLIGNRIAEARTMRGLSLQDIADSIGVARSTIQRYEKGLITNIKLPVISAIADALSVNRRGWLENQKKCFQNSKNPVRIGHTTTTPKPPKQPKQYFVIRISACSLMPPGTQTLIISVWPPKCSADLKIPIRMVDCPYRRTMKMI